jgi:hypothetical protein
VHPNIDLFNLPTLMHNYFIHLQYVCYITILDIFRALTCPSSGGQIVLSQHLVSSLSVNGCTVRRKVSFRPTHETVTDTVTYARWCIDTIDSPDDEHEVDRNM